MIEELLCSPEIKSSTECLGRSLKGITKHVGVLSQIRPTEVLEMFLVWNVLNFSFRFLLVPRVQLRMPELPGRSKGPLRVPGRSVSCWSPCGTICIDTRTEKLVLNSL